MGGGEEETVKAGKKSSKAKSKTAQVVDKKLNTSKDVVAEVAKGAPTATEAMTRTLGAAEVANRLAFTREPTQTNRTGMNGAQRATSAIRYLKGV